MRRRKLLVALAVGVVVAAAAVVLWPRPDRITQENCDRIEKGMSQAEVEAILGGPPGDYTTRQVYVLMPIISLVLEILPPIRWQGNQGTRLMMGIRT